MLFRVMLGIGAATSLFTYIGLRSVPIPERIVVEKPTFTKFNETWNQAAGATMLKSASLATEPKIRVIPIDPPPKAMSPVIAPEPTATPKPRVKEARVEKSRGDVCSRHGMRKVYRGRGWRCR
jgi:hypothetical protein